MWPMGGAHRSAILSAGRWRTCDRGADAESSFSVNDGFSPRFSVRRRRHLRRELLVFCRAPDLYRCGSIADCSCNELVFTLTPAVVTCSKRRPQCVAVSLRRENIEVKLEPAARFLKKWAKKTAELLVEFGMWTEDNPYSVTFYFIHLIGR